MMLRGAVIGLLALMSAGLARAGAYDDLIVAAANDDTGTEIGLLQRGLDVNSVDPTGTTLLMFAARSGNEQLIDFLLDHHANVLNRNKYGDTALMLAAFEGRTPIAERLIRAGSELDPKGGWTPLLYAAFNGRTECARLLLDRGARVDTASANGLTPLMVAVRGGHVETAALLIERHADVTPRNQEGLTALDLATRSGHTEIADLIRRSLAGSANP